MMENQCVNYKGERLCHWYESRSHTAVFFHLYFCLCALIPQLCKKMFHHLIITIDFIPEYNCYITKSTRLEGGGESTNTILSFVSLCLQGFRHTWAFVTRLFQSIFHTLCLGHDRVWCLSFITCWIALEIISMGFVIGCLCWRSTYKHSPKSSLKGAWFPQAIYIESVRWMMKGTFHRRYEANNQNIIYQNTDSEGLMTV